MTAPVNSREPDRERVDRFLVTAYE